jgi:hypothetical protein
MAGLRAVWYERSGVVGDRAQQASHLRKSGFQVAVLTVGCPVPGRTARARGKMVRRCPADSGDPGLGPSHASDGGDRGPTGLTAYPDALRTALTGDTVTRSRLPNALGSAVVLVEARMGKRWRW